MWNFLKICLSDEIYILKQNQEEEFPLVMHPARGSVNSVDFALCSRFCLSKEVLLAAIFKEAAM